MVTMKKKNEEKKTVNDLIIEEAVKQFKEGKITNSLDVENYLDSLLQPLMQKLLDTELENHLEYPKYERNANKESKKSSDKRNFRNGYCNPKTVKTRYGNISVKTPRDRNATFEPVIIEKGQTRLTGFEDKCIALYAKGISLRDIEKTLNEIYGVKINKDDISRLIAAVSEEVENWRNRKLKPMYVFTYADCLYIPIKDDITTSKKAVYIIIGVDTEGYKEILGLWINETESGSFWSNVFEDLRERGVEDILYMCSDGIAGFKGSLERVFPKTQSQRCVVHLVRTIYSLCPRKEAKEIIADYKKIYTSSNIEEANFQLDVFRTKYEKSQKRIVKKAEEFMQYLEPLFELPVEIRTCIYTTNAIESVNSALRKVTRGKGAFPNESAVYKVLYLRIKELSEKWKKPIKNWHTIREQLISLCGDRFLKFIKF